MKSVGQQLQEARLAKNWTPELAARETKIKVDRVRDLEADDYANFSSPTYARGFVRTYARALGLDEYRILRQLDNKLPEDDNASFAPDNGSMPYVPEPSTQAMHVSSAPRTGLYVVLGLGCGVLAIAAFVLLQAYRSGELPRYFASTGSPDNSTNLTSGASVPLVDSETPPHALPVDPNDTTHSVRAMPADPTPAPVAPATNAGAALPAVAAAPATNVAPPSTNAVAAAPATNVAPPSTNAVVSAPVPTAASVSPTNAVAIAPAANAAPPATNAAPAVVAVEAPSTPVHLPLIATPADGPPADPAPSTNSASEPAPAPPVSPAPQTADSTDTPGEKPPPRALPVDPSELVAANQTPPDGTVNPPSPAAPADSTPVDLGPRAMPVDLPGDSRPAKQLVLTASRDSFIRVTSLDAPGGKEVLYSSVLRTGQSLEFDGHKFSINVSIPSAVDIMLDGVNYGPHSDNGSPETFTLQSHQP